MDNPPNEQNKPTDDIPEFFQKMKEKPKK